MTPPPPAQFEHMPFRKDDFRFLSETIHRRTGIVIGESKQDMVYARIQRRLRALDMHSIGEYYGLIKSAAGTPEIDNLVNAVTTNFTNFFREPHHFDHLQNVALPYWRHAISDRQPRRLRIWSAGCATGEEPYSIAMAMEALLGGGHPWDVKILATDIDTNALETARRGRYPKDEVKRVPAKYRGKYFTSGGRDGDRAILRVTPELRRSIVFKQLNLLEAWPMKGPFNAIFCRNVMIYFDHQTQARLVERYTALLMLGGWLVLGHSESGVVGGDALESVGRTIYRRVR